MDDIATTAIGELFSSDLQSSVDSDEVPGFPALKDNIDSDSTIPGPSPFGIPLVDVDFSFRNGQ